MKQKFCISVVMVSGGEDGRGVVHDSVELLYMNGTWICPMPSLPEVRYGHTQTGPIVCGGVHSRVWKSCVTFFSGGDDWVKTHTLAEKREFHSAWTSPKGVMLMGTWYSGTRTGKCVTLGHFLAFQHSTTPK